VTSESIGTDFSTELLKFCANIITIFVVFIFYSEDQGIRVNLKP
jgi:hypothetical protein